MEDYLPNLFRSYENLDRRCYNERILPLASNVYKNMLRNTPEDKIIRQQYKYMEKYIQPLGWMISKMNPNEDYKIKKLGLMLSCLENPSREVPLETLIAHQPGLDKIIAIYNRLPLDSLLTFFSTVLRNTLPSPMIKHTLQRTFKVCLHLGGSTDIRARTLKKRHQLKEQPQEEPHVLLCEIAGLDPKFIVSRDTLSAENRRTTNLICCLDDKLLPAVPPIRVNVPGEYPFVSPSCLLTEDDYLMTPFFGAVQDGLTARISKLPKCYSLSHILNAWEASVRQACSPNVAAVNDLTAIFGM